MSQSGLTRDRTITGAACFEKQLARWLNAVESQRMPTVRNVGILFLRADERRRPEEDGNF
jgi:hypothetical protein